MIVIQLTIIHITKPNHMEQITINMELIINTTEINKDHNIMENNSLMIANQAFILKIIDMQDRNLFFIINKKIL